jgi:hypothetical protein
MGIEETLNQVRSRLPRLHPAQADAASLAADSLRQVGLHRSTDVIGGFNAWRAEGLPFVAPALHQPPETRRRGLRQLSAPFGRIR